MPTATKRKPDTAAEYYRKEAADRVQDLIANQRFLATGAYLLLEDLVDRSPDLLPVELKVTTEERTLLNAAGIECENVHDLIRKHLIRTKGNLELRKRLGSTAAVAKAQAKVDEKNAALSVYRAELADLEVDDNPAVPALKQQIEKLGNRLRELETECGAAEKELNKLQSAYNLLRERAPNPLLDTFAEITATWSKSPEFRRQNELDGQISELNRLLDPQNSAGIFTVNPKHLAPWIETNCPEVISRKHDTTVFDKNLLFKHADKIRTETLPALTVKRDELASKVATLKTAAEKRINQLIDNWIQTGIPDPRER